MNKCEVAILIPCFNEEKTIEKVIKDCRSVVQEATIYVYDNCSTDNTRSIALRAGAIVIDEPKRGKGNVIRSMFQDINADCYVMIDGDDTYSICGLPKMIDLVIEGNTDMVIGNRLDGAYKQTNNRKFHFAGNMLVKKIINLIFNSNVGDIMTGYRAFSALFVKTLPILSEGFEIETEITIHALAHKFRIQEIVVGYQERPIGSISKLKTFRDGLSILKTIIMLFKDYKSLAFFSSISLVFLIIAVILFIPILSEYFRSGIVPRFPTLIIDICFVILSFLSLVCGFILDTINRHHLLNFQLEIIKWKSMKINSKKAFDNPEHNKSAS